MTKEEFKAAFKIADSQEDLSDVDDSNLFGCGLPEYKRTVTTLKAVAKLIRWQALQFNGAWNAEALGEVQKIAKVKFEVVG